MPAAERLCRTLSRNCRRLIKCKKLRRSSWGDSTLRGDKFLIVKRLRLGIGLRLSVSFSDSFPTGTPGRCSASPVSGGGAGAGPELGPPGRCAGWAAGGCATNGNAIANSTEIRTRFISKCLLRYELELSFMRLRKEKLQKIRRSLQLSASVEAYTGHHTTSPKDPSFRPRQLGPL